MDSQTHKPEGILEKAGVSRCLLEAVKKETYLLWTYNNETRQPEEGYYNWDCIRRTGKRQAEDIMHEQHYCNYILPRLQSRLGERVFSYSGPLAWNSLPSADLPNIPDTSSFKKRLKTYLVNSAF